jgi:hypothetical protein
MKTKAIKSVFSDDLDVLGALSAREAKAPSLEALRELFKGEDGGTPEKGVDYFTPEEVKAFKEEIRAGATPKKFVDYFTDSEIEFIMETIKEDIIPKVTPKKGRDYRDGDPGRPGKDADEREIVKKVVLQLRDLDKEQDAIDFSPKKLAEKLNTLEGVLDGKVIKGWVKVEDVVKAIKEGKLLEMKDLKASGGFNMNDQRWHGGGSSSSTGGLNRLTVTGTIDDANVSFTVSDTPTYMIINGSMYAQGDTAGGVVVWTNVAGAVTLAFPVGSGGSISALG